MKKVLLILNPVAGMKQSHTALFDILNEFTKADFLTTVAVTQRRGHASDLAHDAKENGFDLVVCIGGDGTLNEAIAGLLRDTDKSPLPLGYIPAGSTNDFAETLGISSNPKQAAKAITKCKGRPLDIGRFGGNRNFSYIASFGAFTAASYSAPQELKNTVGHFAYVLEGIKELPQIRSHKASIKANGNTYEDNYIFGAVSNTMSVGGIVKLSEKIVDLKDGMFEVTLVKKPKDLIELNKILTGALTSDLSGDMFEFFKTDKLEISMGKSVPWTLDGEEAKGDSSITIENLHNAIELYI